MIRPTPAENFRRIWTQKKRELNLTQTQAAEKLGWNPRITFDELVRLMVDADISMLEKNLK